MHIILTNLVSLKRAFLGTIQINQNTVNLVKLFSVRGLVVTP